VSVRPRVAIVSPFVDKQHGTERCLAEQIARLADRFEIHLYSHRVQDIELNRIIWHRVPRVPGPHLLAYCWWFLANHLWRWWDQKVRGLRFDLVYTPGINCLDADVILVHVVFSELRRQMAGLSLSKHPVSNWARLIHRRMYFHLISALERLIYARQRGIIAAVSQRTANRLATYGRHQVTVIYHGLDGNRFNLARRQQLRKHARLCLNLANPAFCLLLIGNDWRNKGLATILEAMASLPSLHLQLIVVGSDDPAPFRKMIDRHGLSQNVQFLHLREDVEFYYGAADAYVSPVFEDAFGLPVLEAMGCGLPVIVSSCAGASEVIRDGVDGMILEDPGDAGSLAKLISQLQSDRGMCRTLSSNAARTAAQYTWARNAAELARIFEKATA